MWLGGKTLKNILRGIGCAAVAIVFIFVPIAAILSWMNNEHIPVSILFSLCTLLEVYVIGVTLYMFTDD